MSTHMTSDEKDRRRSASIHSLPDDNDCYDTDKELNRKMGVLGPCEMADYSHFHPQYQF